MDWFWHNTEDLNEYDSYCMNSMNHNLFWPGYCSQTIMTLNAVTYVWNCRMLHDMFFGYLSAKGIDRYPREIRLESNQVIAITPTISDEFR